MSLEGVPAYDAAEEKSALADDDEIVVFAADKSLVRVPISSRIASLMNSLLTGSGWAVFLEIIGLLKTECSGLSELGNNQITVTLSEDQTNLGFKTSHMSGHNYSVESGTAKGYHLLGEITALRTDTSVTYQMSAPEDEAGAHKITIFLRK